MNQVWRYSRIALAVVLLVALSVSGFWGVDQEWKYAASAAEKFSTVMQIAYSVLGLLAVPVLLLQLRGLQSLLYAWAFCLLLTGATVPVIWGGSGWWAGFFAACLMGAISGVVIWLAPLPQAQGRFRRWRWLLAGLFAVAAVVVLSVVVQMAPAVLRGHHMEKFCSGVPEGLDRKGFIQMAQQEGYIVTPDHDAKGDFLRLDDDRSGGGYRCEARFKPDGKIGSMNFSAGPKPKPK